MVVCQSSLLPSSSSSIRACSKVEMYQTYLGPHLGFFVNYNAAGMGVMLFFLNINSHPSFFLPSSCLHRLWQPTPEPIYLTLNRLGGGGRNSPTGWFFPLLC